MDTCGEEENWEQKNCIKIHKCEKNTFPSEISENGKNWITVKIICLTIKYNYRHCLTLCRILYVIENYYFTKSIMSLPVFVVIILFF